MRRPNLILCPPAHKKKDHLPVQPEAYLFFPNLPTCLSKVTLQGEERGLAAQQGRDRVPVTSGMLAPKSARQSLQLGNSPRSGCLGPVRKLLFQGLLRAAQKEGWFPGSQGVTSALVFG